MRAGKLRDRVVIQANVAAADQADQYGEVVPQWSNVATVWAKVEEVGGRENWQADQVRPDRTITVTMRYYAGLTSKHRLLFGSRILNVGSVVNPDGKRREHLLSCTEEC